MTIEKEFKVKINETEFYEKFFDDKLS